MVSTLAFSNNLRKRANAGRSARRAAPTRRARQTRKKERTRSDLAQVQVACLADAEGHLALEKEDPFTLQTKPHGHGDVHVLLHTSGLAKKWRASGVQWVCFFQDTNGLVFRGLPAALGQHSRPLCDPRSDILS